MKMKRLLAAQVFWNVISTVLSIVNDGCVCDINAGAYAPVCTSNGQTYRNTQLVQCYNQCNAANLQIVAYQACSTYTPPVLTPQPTCVCDINAGAYAPVCTSNGQTYRNTQLVQCFNQCYAANLQIVAYQACGTNTAPVLTPQPTCVCDINAGAYAPVCTSNGQTYRNTQLVQCFNQCYASNLQIVAYQACSANTLPVVTPQPTCVCDIDAGPIAPVCTSNRQTYRNTQLVQCFNRCYASNLQIVAYEACSNIQGLLPFVTPQPTCVCDISAGAYAPVCGSNGQTYRNTQLVQCFNQCYAANLQIVANAACSNNTQVISPIVTPIPAINNTGRCDCPNKKPYSLVCGSDGRTYASVGLLQCYNRCYNMNLSVIRQGYCPKNLCICTNTKEYNPVCGSNKKTYRNPKIVQCLNICQNANIRIVKYQPC